MQIRSVSDEDFEAVSDLLGELGRPAVTPSTHSACLGVFAAQLADPSCDHLIARDDDGRAVGFCSLHFRGRLNQPTHEAWIPDLIVTEGARGAGVGRALLEEARRRAAERGCHQLTLESGHERRRAHGVYEAAGLIHTGRAYGQRLP
ncbi:MAG TPA: GNAT family N-acetyltransferase [Solirubrobacteraceae bacterium]|jgi:GNAT superfamily N-acetyltransferase|nr:GNAT family N-acetyltransferase [Solirubrobacteraceae bacterium]